MIPKLFYLVLYPSTLILLFCTNLYLIYSLSKYKVKEILLNWLRIEYLNLFQILVFTYPFLEMLNIYWGCTFASTYEYIHYFARWRNWISPSLNSTYLLINLMAGFEIAKDYLNLPYMSVTSNVKYIRIIKGGILVVTLFIHLHNIVLYTVREIHEMTIDNIKTKDYYIAMKVSYKDTNLVIMICLRILVFNLIPLSLLTIFIALLMYLCVKGQLPVTRTVGPWIMAKYKYNKHQSYMISLNSKANRILEFTSIQELSTNLDLRDTSKILFGWNSMDFKKYFEKGGDLKIFLIFTLAYYPLYLMDLLRKVLALMKYEEIFDETHWFNMTHNFFNLWSISLYSLLWLLILNINKTL
ncbi:unnamed protein product [Gordionus sp. m RMFG-2023]